MKAIWKYNNLAVGQIWWHREVKECWGKVHNYRPAVFLWLLDLLSFTAWVSTKELPHPKLYTTKFNEKFDTVVLSTPLIYSRAMKSCSLTIWQFVYQVGLWHLPQERPFNDCIMFKVWCRGGIWFEIDFQLIELLMLRDTKKLWTVSVF